MMIHDRYAVEITIEHYARLGNDNREVIKLLQPFAEAIALESLSK